MAKMTWIQAKPMLVLAAAISLVAMVTTATAASTTTPFKPPTTTIPTVPKDPPPGVTTTPNPPPRMAPDRTPDMRDFNPVGRVAIPTEPGAPPRKAVVNRLENRSATSRAVDQASSLAVTQGAKLPARELLETAKPIL